MAIINGPFASKSRGRAGEVVFAKTTGNRTAMRSYQPKVKNPKTLRQQVSRIKMKQASAIAAIFSEVVGIGYAKAVQGTKMYARNMFVSILIPQDNDYFTVTNGVVTRSNKNLPLSRAYGLTAVPTVTVEEQAGVGYAVTVSGYSSITLNPGEKLGIIVCAYKESAGLVAVEKVVASNDAETTVTLSPAIFLQTSPDRFCAFFKVIPAAENGVATETIPWKYPSATSACGYVNY